MRSLFILSLFDTGLYVAQSLGKHCSSIFGFDHIKTNPGFKSKYIKSKLIKNPIEHSGSVLKILIELASQFNEKPLLVPASELYLTFIYNNREALNSLFVILLPNQDVLFKILNKVHQSFLAINAGILVPKFQEVSNCNELDNINSTFKYPLIIKANDQSMWKNKGLNKAYIVNCYDDLLSISNYLFGYEITFFIQEYVDNDITNNFEYNALMIDGKIVHSAVIQKLKQVPEKYGIASVVRLIENERIKSLGAKFILGNDIEGFSNTEFKYDDSSDKYYFIETNSRVWQQIKLTNTIGANFVLLYYNYYTDQKITFKESSFRSIYWVDILSELSDLKQHGFQINRFFNFLSVCFKAKYFGLFCWNDIRPFLYKIKQYIR